MLSVTNSKVHAHCLSLKKKICTTSMSNNLLKSKLPIRHEYSALVKNCSAYFVLRRLSPSIQKQKACWSAWRPGEVRLEHPQMSAQGTHPRPHSRVQTELLLTFLSCSESCIKKKEQTVATKHWIKTKVGRLPICISTEYKFSFQMVVEDKAKCRSLASMQHELKRTVVCFHSKCLHFLWLCQDSRHFC